MFTKNLLFCQCIHSEEWLSMVVYWRGRRERARAIHMYKLPISKTTLPAKLYLKCKINPKTFLNFWNNVIYSIILGEFLNFFTNLTIPLGQTHGAQFTKMLQSLNSPANHLTTCLTLSKSLSLRHSNHLCVIYSWPFGEQKECNVANPQQIRRRKQSGRLRCWKIFAWLWTCALAGKGSDAFWNSGGNPHDFSHAFHMGFSQLTGSSAPGAFGQHLHHDSM